MTHHRCRILPAVVVAATFAVAARGSTFADDAATPPAGVDPIVARRSLLERWDSEVDAQCARSHLEARRILDEVMPLPYLGIDADAAGGGMKVTRVVAATAAEAAGLEVGDVIVAFGDAPTPNAAALGSVIRRTRIGQPVVMRVRRDDAERDVSIALRARPEEDEDEDEGAPKPEPPKPFRIDFETDAADAPPPAFDVRLGGHGAPPKFVVGVDKVGNHLLLQMDQDATGIRFPMAIAKGWRSADAVVRVGFHVLGGRQDRAAGVVVRWRDEANYLVARVNAVEGDLRIFRVANGLRRTLPGARAPAPPDDTVWHTIEVRAVGPKVTATLDGRVTVTSFDTYVSGDRIGVWTKSDSAVAFDNVEAKAAAP